jgi:hypothetical protein
MNINGLGGVNRPQYNFSVQSNASMQKSSSLNSSLQTYLEKKGEELAKAQPSKNQPETLYNALKDEEVKKTLLGEIHEFTKGAQIDEIKFSGAAIALAILGLKKSNQE